MVMIELTPTDSDVSVEVSAERIGDEIGRQGILGDDVENTGHMYLAALALECRESGTSIEDTLDEFIKNSYALDDEYPCR